MAAAVKARDALRIQHCDVCPRMLARRLGNCNNGTLDFV
jgi:hypothetical protein